jgi:diguanylate cyclase
MLLQNIDRNELQLILTQLDQALYNHQQWHNDLIRTLACRLPYDKHDILPEAYKECRFGQWYYNNTSKHLLEYQGFTAIGEAHKYMHLMASQVLTKLSTSNSVIPLDYDNFANSLEKLRLEIYAFKSELETLLYNRDPLTMTINRVSMLPVLRELQDMIRRQYQSCCIAMMDLDSFKKVNDQYGHLIGDKVLATVAHFLIEHLRPYDKIFRYGGEEFLLCIQQVDVSQANKMLDRLREEIAKLPINVGLDAPLYITVSFGITELDPNATVERSIDRADKALYLAKTSGRNRTQIWKEN